MWKELNNTRLETITLEDLKETIDSLIKIHGPNKEVSDFCITIKNSSTYIEKPHVPMSTITNEV